MSKGTTRKGARSYSPNHDMIYTTSVFLFKKELISMDNLHKDSILPDKPMTIECARTTRQDEGRI